MHKMEREMKFEEKPKVDVAQHIYTLRHIETGEFICLRHEGNEYLASFSDGDTAIQFRDDLGILEHVDIVAMPLGKAPFDHFWLDGDMVAHPVPGVDEKATR